MEEKWITSVGLDVGTSTTKLIVSQLRLARVSGRTDIPKFQIVERKLTYASPIYSTPLVSQDEIDIRALDSLLQREYSQASLSLSDVKSGAVIITGETATKKNAEQIVHYLAERAGDFVVAVAGADLEGVLAGKGAGAQNRSIQSEKVIANVDIGGGTANVAYFQRGKAIATLTFHIGGRLIQLDKAGAIRYLSPNLHAWLAGNGYHHVAEGRQVSYEQLSEVLTHLNRSMLDLLTGTRQDRTAGLLVLGDLPERLPRMDEMMVSGGVGQLMREKAPESLAETAVYGDIGPLLAHTLLAECKRQAISLVAAAQTVRATVIGAGMESAEISGSTVFINAALLPIRNLPVCKLDLANLGEPAMQAAIEQALSAGVRLYGGHASPPFAIALKGLGHCSFAMVQLLAETLANGYRTFCPEAAIMAVICENDMAKALGQSLAVRCRERPQIICIDQIQVEHGDYIDLGEPIAQTMIPVMIKTLAFHTGA